MGTSSPSAPRIFVSHSHEDDEYCRAYVEELRRLLGGDRDAVWYDEHNLTAGELMREIQRQLHARPIFVVIVSKAALHRSQWVVDECSWAYDLYRADRSRIILPVAGSQMEENDFIPDWIYLRVFRRLEAPGLCPFSPVEAAARTAALIGQTIIVHQPAILSAPAPQPTPTPLPVRPPIAHLPPDRFPPRLESLGYTAHLSADGTEFILPPLCDVPAGEFLMGRDPKQDPQVWPEEQRQLPVTLPEFQIAKFPVTVAEFACFVAARHTAPEKGGLGVAVDWDTQLTRLDHPAVCVSWYDAYDYAAWLGECAVDRHWRLCTEFEWEKAARFDPVHPKSVRTYPWGDLFEAGRCNTWEGDKGTTTPVGSYPAGASPCGVEDLAGNVWEWTSSIWNSEAHSKEPGQNTRDRDVRSPNEDRVLRGGSWNSESRFARVTSRYGRVPDQSSNVIGFRLSYRSH